MICFFMDSSNGLSPVQRQAINTLRPRQNGRHFADDTFKRIFLKENVRIWIKISLKFVHKGPINNIPALVQIMAWRRSGDKPLSESMTVSLLTHICVTRPQWVNSINTLPLCQLHTWNKPQSNWNKMQWFAYIQKWIKIYGLQTGSLFIPVPICWTDPQHRWTDFWGRSCPCIFLL